MSGKFAAYGVLFLMSSAMGGLIDISRLDRDEKKEPEKKPNIVKDYVCLRDGELCHPNFAMNRGLYVSCSNGVAWEQACPRCSYHPLNCPTKTLWFDGEKCEWASPKLASQPCVDRLPLYDIHNGSSSKEGGPFSSPDSESYFHGLQSVPGGPLNQFPSSMGNHPGMVNKEQTQNQLQADKGKWPGLSSNLVAPPQPPPGFYKSPKTGESPHESDLNEQDDDAGSAWDDETESSFDNAKEEEKEEKTSGPKSASPVSPPANAKLSRRKSAPEPSDAEAVDVDNSDAADLPNYLNSDNTMSGPKIVRLNEPVYALVDSPDGDGKQVLVKVSQPFVFEDDARTLLPALNALSPYEKKD